MTTPDSSSELASERQYPVRRYNQRMARRIARRAKLDENAVAVAFTFNNLLTMCIFGTIEDTVKYVPVIGEYAALGISLLSFWFHRIVLVTDEHVYVYRDLPFHYPRDQIAAYRRKPGVVRIGSPNPTSGFSRFIRRGQLTFEDGLTAYHSILWIRRARYIDQEANLPAGE